MIWFLLACVAVVVLIVAVSLPRSRSTSSVPKTQDKRTPDYIAQTSLLNGSEQSFYHRASKVLPPDHIIFTKARLSDIVDVSPGITGSTRLSLHNRISQKHVDFVLCNAEFKPYLVVEIDGNSHDKPNQKRSDAVKNEILNEAGIPIIRYRIGTDWDFSLLTKEAQAT